MPLQPLGGSGIFQGCYFPAQTQQLPLRASSQSPLILGSKKSSRTDTSLHCGFFSGTLGPRVDRLGKLQGLKAKVWSLRMRDRLGGWKWKAEGWGMGDWEGGRLG